MTLAPGLTNLHPSELAKRIRAHALRMTFRTKASHIGSCLSIAELLAVCYGRVLDIRPGDPSWPGRDRMIISKGHAAAAVYAVLAETGFFPVEWLEKYHTDAQPLAGHVSAANVPGVELSTGSLGHGLPVGCGMALAGRGKWRVFALLGDGECDEGAVWEAALIAGHQRLDNLVAMVDFNGLQSFGRVTAVSDLAPFADKWEAFRWRVVEVDGHDVDALERALSSAAGHGAPTVVIAHTVKGKGVSFMEDRLEWHYKSPNETQLAAALAELGLS